MHGSIFDARKRPSFLFIFARFGRFGRFGIFGGFVSVVSVVSLVSVVSFRSFQWFRFVVSGFSTCHQDSLKMFESHKFWICWLYKRL